MPVAGDVIVVGGGVNGASLAFHLARRGLAATLLERRTIASGPTGRSCGIVRQHYSHEVTARMARRALEIFERFDDLVGGDCGFHRTGAVVPVREAELPALEANVAIQRSVGVDARIVSPEELAEIEPAADLEGIVAAAWEPDAGYADPYSTSTAYAERAAELGADVRTGVTVLDLESRGGRVEAVLTDGGRLQAGAVVLAAGPWTRELAARAGIELPLAPARVQVTLFDRPARIGRHGILLDTALGIYTRPEGDLMLVGSLDPDEAVPVGDPDHFPETADFDRVHRYAEQASKRYPAMAHGAYRHGYASLYDLSPDWQPILDRLPGYDNLYCVAGSSGHGFKLAPVVGEMMAELVAADGAPQADLEMFSFERFAAGQSSAGRYRQKILG